VTSTVKQDKVGNRASAALLSLVSILLVVGLLVGLAEVAVRVLNSGGMDYTLEMWKYAKSVKSFSSDPLIGHEHRPFAQAHLMGVDVATNSIGHRDHEYPVERQPGVPRIIMLGDSFIEGWGVPFDETITKRLERMFQDSGRKVEVMNTGVGNYGSVQEVEGFLTRDAKFKPDIVVLNFDFRSAIPIPKYEYDNWLGRHSEGMVFLMGGMDSFFRLAGANTEWDQSYLDLFKQPGWQDAKAAIHRLADYCRQHGIRITIPRKRNECHAGPFARALYRTRERVERMINRFKQSRRLATRYEKCAVNYHAMWLIAAILLWL
jgi:hypothetical protein